METLVFASRRPAILLIAGFAAALSTAGIAAVPFYTRGEPREALVVREMVEGGGWVLPLRNGIELPRKPPFFHWVGAAVGLGLGGVDELTVRLPSALFSVAAVLLVFTWANATRGPTAGALTALLTATTFEWMRAASVARVDMVYAGLLTLALVSLDRLLRREPREPAWRWALYAAVAAAVLTKGPIALVITGLVLSVVAWARPETGLWRRVRPGVGLAVVVAAAGAWILLAFQRHGPDFLDLVVTENSHHLIATDAGGTGHAHGAPYLFGVAALGMLPWTPLLPLVVPALRRRLSEPSVLLAGVWTVVVFWHSPDRIGKQVCLRTAGSPGVGLPGGDRGIGDSGQPARSLGEMVLYVHGAGVRRGVRRPRYRGTRAVLGPGDSRGHLGPSQPQRPCGHRRRCGRRAGQRAPAHPRGPGRHGRRRAPGPGRTAPEMGSGDPDHRGQHCHVCGGVQHRHPPPSCTTAEHEGVHENRCGRGGPQPAALLSRERPPRNPVLRPTRDPGSQGLEEDASRIISFRLGAGLAGVGPTRTPPNPTQG